MVPFAELASAARGARWQAAQDLTFARLQGVARTLQTCCTCLRLATGRLFYS